MSEVYIVRSDAVFEKRGFDLKRSVALHARVGHDFMDIEPVAAQHALLREFHLAAVAGVRLLAGVRKHVSVEVAFARELQSAQWTLELDAALRVNIGDVTLEAAVEREAASAVLALEGTDSQMRSQVFAQLRLASKRLAAQVAREFARKVDGAVLLEAAALLERLAADVANARADLGKVTEAVVAKVGPLAECLAADVARLRALSANRHHTPPISSLATSVSRAARLFHRDAMRVSLIADNRTAILR
jgi:hypothetical protein